MHRVRLNFVIEVPDNTTKPRMIVRCQPSRMAFLIAVVSSIAIHASIIIERAHAFSSHKFLAPLAITLKDLEHYAFLGLRCPEPGLASMNKPRLPPLPGQSVQQIQAEAEDEAGQPRQGESLVGEGEAMREEHRLDASASSTLLSSTPQPSGPSSLRSMRRLYRTWNGVQEVTAAYMDVVRAVVGQEEAWPLDGRFALERLNITLGHEPGGAQPIHHAHGLRAHAKWTAQGMFAPLPYVTRVQVPQQADVVTFGDLHGSFHSLLRSLRSLVADGRLTEDLVARQGTFMLFLGDYVDRGAYGLDTLLTLLILRARNPYRVFLSRGNHEDEPMNGENAGGTFWRELRAHFPEEHPSALRQLFRVYETLPRAIYLGVQSQALSDDSAPAHDGSAPQHPLHLQCCHGGIEVGFDPRPLLRLKGSLASGQGEGKGSGGALVSHALIHGHRRGEWLSSLDSAQGAEGLVPSGLRRLFKDIGGRPWWSLYGMGQDAEGVAAEAHTHNRGFYTWDAGESASSMWPLQPLAVDPADGFMWNDFLVDDATTPLLHLPGRGLAFGLPLTRRILTDAGVAGVLRAHQHNDNDKAGPMLSRVRADGGMHDNWGGSGLVLTFLSGAHIPPMLFTRDSYGILSLSGPPHDTGAWRVQMCGMDVEGPYTMAGSSTGGGEGGLSWVDGREPPAPWSALHAAHGEFTAMCSIYEEKSKRWACRGVEWKAGQAMAKGMA